MLAEPEISRPLIPKLTPGDDREQVTSKHHFPTSDLILFARLGLASE